MDQTDIKKAVEKRQAEIEKKISRANGKKFEPDMNFIKDCVYLDELGDGTLFAALNHDDYLFIKRTQEWFIWKNHFWELDIMDRSLAAAEVVRQAYLKKAASNVARIDWAQKKDDAKLEKNLQDEQKKTYKRAKRLLKLTGRLVARETSHTLPENSLAISGDELDKDPYLVACENGVIDLRLGELRDGRRDDYISKCCPVEWRGIDTPAPHWEKFLQEIFLKDESLINYVQRLLGYAMAGLTVEHILPVFWGEQGRNGKGTLIETILTIMGNYAAPIQAEMLLDQGRGKSSSGPSPDIMHLRGLRMAFASETDEHRRFSTSRIKWLSGGDTLIGRSPHDKYPVTFQATHSLFLMTNNKPHAPSDDSAFWERVHLIPFRVSFVRREPQGEFERPADIYLTAKLKKEPSGILAWLVRGFLQWQSTGLCPPKIVTEATAEYRRQEDQFADFVDACLYLDPDAECESTRAYDVFKDWWSESVSKKKTPSHTMFGRWMGKKFKKIPNSNPVKYAGVGLLEPAAFGT